MVSGVCLSSTITNARNELPWADTPAPHYMAFRDSQGRPSQVVGVVPHGAGFNQVRLASWPLSEMV